MAHRPQMRRVGYGDVVYFMLTDIGCWRSLTTGDRVVTSRGESMRSLPPGAWRRDVTASGPRSASQRCSHGRGVAGCRRGPSTRLTQWAVVATMTATLLTGSVPPEVGGRWRDGRGSCGGDWTVGDGDAMAWHPTLAGRASRYCFAATLVNSGDSARGGQPVGAFIDWVLIRAARWPRLKLTISS